MSNQIVGSDPFAQPSLQDDFQGDIDTSMAERSNRPAPMTQRLSRGIPSEPLLGRLPLAGLIPQDVHSIVDYGNGIAVGSGITSRDPRAKLASIVLAASVVGVSALTDYRLSVAKVIPIEAHEAIDHLWGLSAIAAPFVFGYWKTSPKIAVTHVVTGVATILASLVTDYRAYRGVGHRARRAAVR
jgi:hypothetical protein